MTALIFIIDIQIPLGVAGGVPYVAVVLLGAWFPHRRHVVVLAVGSSLATIAGYFASPEGGIQWMVLTNRGLALLAIWTCALLLTMWRKTQYDVLAEKKRAEDFLEISEAIIVQLDAERRIVTINDRGSNLLGYPAAEIIGQDWMELCIPPDQQEIISDVHVGVMSESAGAYDHFENEIVTRSGELRCIAWNNKKIVDRKGRLLGTLSSGQDITERKKAQLVLARANDELEQRVAERTEEMRMVTDMLPVVVAHFDRDQHIKFANKTACNWFGLYGAEATGLGLRDCTTNCAYEYLKPRLAKALAGNAQHFEARLDFRDGTDREVDVSIVPYVDPNGGVPGAIALFIDVTKSKNHEAEMVSAREDAEYANRAKSEFLANMSHELRTPMNAILGFSQMIRDQILGSDDARIYVDYAGDIIESGEHLLDIINDILDLSKIESGKAELREREIDIEETVHKCLTLVGGRAAEFDLVLENRMGLEGASLWVDERMFKQMLLNLLSNAIKFTPAGGHIMVEAECLEEGSFEVTIRDTGIGIANGDIPKVMSPFGQTADVFTQSNDGTGLGLPLVRSMAELHGGSLTIESEIGIGTRAKISLPGNRCAC